MPQTKVVSRRKIAGERVASAYAALARCHLCEHHCGTNRFESTSGVCRAGAETRVFSAQIEVTDELELIPTFAIALSGCDLRCSFCITGRQSWNPRAGKSLSPFRLAMAAQEAIEEGARSIMILGGEPSVHLPAVLKLAAALPESVPLIWKTNGHASAQARAFLQGIFDVWLVDYKFGNDLCASELAKVPAYTRAIQTNLVWAAQNSELIIRHLLMPGHVECCWRRIAAWISEHLPEVKVSLITAFWPAWRSSHHPELSSPLCEAETARAHSIAAEYQLNLIP